MTLAEKQAAVKENAVLFNLYCIELQQRKISYSKKGCVINGKKVGIQTYQNATKYAAAYVFDNQADLISRKEKQTQKTLF